LGKRRVQTYRFDTTLKLLLRKHATVLFQELDGRPVQEWLNVEIPKVEARRADLLARLDDGALLHIELQSTNDPEMGLRMLEYSTGVYRMCRRFPKQIVLYVGQAPVKMDTVLAGEGTSCEFEVRDIRDLDGEALLASNDLGDNVLAVLTGLRNQRAAVSAIVAKIAGSRQDGRATALQQLTVLAGLRALESEVEEEISRMPLLIDILENKVLGREYLRGWESGNAQGMELGMERGLERGLQRGIEHGARSGELALLRKMLRKRFGPIPTWADERLALKTTGELEDLGLRLLDARNYEEFLQ
jgi:predicted transposase YdaD